MQILRKGREGLFILHQPIINSPPNLGHYWLWGVCKLNGNQLNLQPALFLSSLKSQTLKVLICEQKSSGLYTIYDLHQVYTEMRFLWIVKIFWEMAWGRDDGRCFHMSVWGYCEAALPPTPGLCRLVVGPWQGEPALMWFARSSVLATPQGSVLRIKQVLVWFLQHPASHHGARCSDCQLESLEL